MNDFRADLHCHSTYSDGTLTPKDLIELAATNGLKGLSITDHDTVGAYPEALTYGTQRGIAVIPGIEFSASHKGKPVHILGYSFCPTSSSIIKLCETHITRRTERNQAIVDRLASLGLPVDTDDMPSIIANGSIGRPHIAAAMVKRGYVGSVQEAFKKYLREGGPGYAPGARITVEETIQAIRDANGLAVIAHPHLIQDESLINQLLSMDFDGIEVFYGYFPLDKCTRWLDLAQKRNWVITGGSDFHGDVKPNIVLGASWTPQEMFQRLYDHYSAGRHERPI